VNDTGDKVVGAVFCLSLAGGRYDACRGRVVFRGGRLVGLQVGRSQLQQNEAGLTAGFTILTDLTALPAGPGAFGRGRAVTRLYVRGVLECETDLGDVDVNTDRL
jgi:hypothetical protein